MNEPNCDKKEEGVYELFYDKKLCIVVVITLQDLFDEFAYLYDTIGGGFMDSSSWDTISQYIPTLARLIYFNRL